MATTRRSGQIIPKGKDRWQIRVSFGRDRATGKRMSETETVRGSKSEAQALLNQKLAEIDKGKYVRKTKISLREYIENWLKDVVRVRVREATFESYKYHLEHYVLDQIGGRFICDLTGLQLQRFTNDMTEKYSPRTVRYVFTIIKNALSKAVEMRLISTNPCEFVELPKQTRRSIKVFTPDEARRFLEAASSNSRGIIFEFALLTGARPEEYLAIRWSDLDLVRGNVTFQRTIYWKKGGGWVLIDATKTDLSRRTLPLPRVLVSRLKNHRKRQAENILAIGHEYERNDLVFANEFGRPLHYGNITKRNFQPILKSAGLGHHRLYSLRHSCATLLLAQGENIKVIQERLGHADVVLTLSTYSHVLDGMQAQASAKLSELLYAEAS